MGNLARCFFSVSEDVAGRESHVAVRVTQRLVISLVLGRSTRVFLRANRRAYASASATRKQPGARMLERGARMRDRNAGQREQDDETWGTVCRTYPRCEIAYYTRLLAILMDVR